ncbi:hypothetical protein I6N95_09090 [Vagococcus sp. BWB3-3]|uniref:Uncharacterized protein n=1 Tax=Vagococcus allomyrinae TaxID=2794353 RepID=A0A940SW97_9ENTE|nr:hypothetical protein [Vagococcus allomyrinae]MBP1041158.1 hypothetical protein [Vagococcus allomyrinae]
MTEYEKKTNLVLESIAETIMALDETLSQIETSHQETTRTREMKKWYEEKKAIHELKRLLYDNGKYNTYDPNELKKTEAYFDIFIN